MIRSSILDIPDKILVKIILHFNARERLALANSCKNLNHLIFGNEELLRDLDFSNDWQLTSERDIQQYFNNENTYKHILKMNIENVNAENILRTSIGKAMNIVDLNILGTKIRYVDELRSLLEPLLHLKRLSVNWPILGDYDDPICNKVLEKPLNRLTYLSLELYRYSREFLLTLQFCQQLEELRMVTIMPSREREISFSQEPMKLKNLKVVQCRGAANLSTLTNDFLVMIPNPADWTDFFYLGHLDGQGYLERSIEVCEELLEVKYMLPPKNIPYPYHEDVGWPLFPEHLLSVIINVTHQDAPEKFCCLSSCTYSSIAACLLKIDEAKRLLKNPEYQVSYLQFSHVIEKNCDAHLLVSAFPNLTELVIPRICNWDSYPVAEGNEPFRRRLRKRNSIAPEEHNDPTNPDSSFKMLIENTPHLKGLTICPTDVYNRENEAGYWDFNALYLIPRWKNLMAIRLKQMPIPDGNFLIGIGKECTKLEEIMLYDLSPVNSSSFTNELLQMLQYCRSLKKFSICQPNIQHMTEIFSTLSNNSKLRHVRLMTATEAYDSLELASSIEKMLHQCPELTKFVIKIHSLYNRVVDELKPALQRVVSELNRPNFQFHGPEHSGRSYEYEDPATSFFPLPSDDQEFASYSC